MNIFMHYSGDISEEDKKKLVLRSIIERLFYQLNSAIDRRDIEEACRISKKANRIFKKYNKSLFSEVKLTEYGWRKLLYYYMDHIE